MLTLHRPHIHLGRINLWNGSGNQPSKKTGLGMILRVWRAGIIASALISLLVRAAPAAGIDHRHGWEFTLSGEYQLVDNSAADIERGMRIAHLDGNPCGNPGEIFCMSAPTPYSDHDRLSYTLALGRALNPRFGLLALYSGSDLGSSYGYFDGGYGDIYDADLEIRHKRLAVLGLALEFRPSPEIYLGLGPAFYQLDFETVTGDAQFFDSHRARRLGFIAIGGVTLPKSSLFFVNASVQYRHAGNFALGPFDARNILGDVLTTMPETKVSINHTVMLLGIGARI
jgi:opacity protein-like surface antigen